MALELSLKSSRGDEPSTMQWTVTIPGELTSVEEVVPGPAARAASKSATCAVRTKTATEHIMVCFLYGGIEAIRDGVIAVLRLDIPPDAKPGPSRIRIDKALAVSKDLKRVPLQAVQAVVTIRGK